jgi:hypothetical protein
MAGTRFQVKSYGANLVARHLAGVAGHASDIAPCASAATTRVADGYRRSFSRQGPGWTPLKGKTIRNRIAEGYPPGPILRRSGSYESAATNPFSLIVHSSNDEISWAVNHEVAKYHQGGTSRMPARPIRLSFGDRMQLIKILSDYIIDGYDVA